MIMQSYKIRLEPNNKQQSKMFQSAGTARWAYNYTLAKMQEHYKETGKSISEGVLRKELTQLKQTNEYSWLYGYSNNIVKQAIKDGYGAYDKFFKGLSKFPKFKSKKKSKPSFYVDTHKIQFTGTHVKLEKLTSNKKKNKQLFNWIKLSEKDKIPHGGDVSYYNPRVSFDGLYWYISVTVEVEGITQENTGDSLGIDLGVSELAICSDGKRYKNINKTKRVARIEKKLKRLQRQVSRKYDMNKDGNKYIKTKNIVKLEKTIKKIHNQLGNIRTDYRHKITTEIVKTKPSRIVVESLNVSGMMKNKHLSRAIQNQGFYEFKTMLSYKSNKHGIEFIEADRWFPSSKMCSDCGNIKRDLKLSDRVYSCECGLNIDRDLNASLNLANYQVL